MTAAIVLVYLSAILRNIVFESQEKMFKASVVFTQLFSGVARSNRRENRITQNSQSRSFNVMHFDISEKQTMGCTSPYNNL